ncbi:response regulator [Rhodopirellula sallentina]|uniref:Signal transduction response regulator, receiver region domain protein n=1 Tax=Rhodopirellula sallentina SM41 TaxID=1263870 RepID=M5TYY1_9BACT|nr:response regulator [Rhodopirellula sallentina]EMI54427.1 Signal transduction response regulator, receiver region domain protein [Rhodopirellula sallentina SM41]
MQPVFEGRRCVIADDVRSSREVLNRWLQEFGLVTSCESDGLAAWESIQEDDCDLLITDIEMPGMSGLELLNNMRSGENPRYQNMPAIVVTSLLDEQVADVVQDFGGTTLVLKPLNKTVLHEVVGCVLSQRPVEPVYMSLQSDIQEASGISPSLRYLVERARANDC